MASKVDDFIQRYTLPPVAKEELLTLLSESSANLRVDASAPGSDGEDDSFVSVPPQRSSLAGLQPTLDTPPLPGSSPARQILRDTSPANNVDVSTEANPSGRSSPKSTPDKRKQIPAQTAAFPLDTEQGSGDEPISQLGESLESFSTYSSDDSIPSWIPQERYEVLGELGRGGMGTVWRVFDHRLKRELALKSVNTEWLGSASVLSRFVEEAQATSQLQHPGIVPVYDLELHPNGHCFFTMKIIEGRTLTEVIQEYHRGLETNSLQRTTSSTSWSLRQLLDALRRVCEAVAYAHSRGVLHRDLKPHNVMLGLHGEVLVLDWGLVKVKHARPSAHEGVMTERAEARLHETVFGAVQGTPSYMPPEQAAGDQDQLGPHSDIYSLGAILYEILAGRPPVQGRSPYEVLSLVQQGSIPPPARPEGEERLGTRWDGAWSASNEELPQAPGELLQICDRALSLNPQHRHGTANDLAQELSDWLEGRLQQERALRIVEKAKSLLPEAHKLREQAQTLAHKASIALGALGTWEPEDKKKQSWAEQDKAQELEREARRKELEYERLLHAAFTYDPDLEEARVALATTYFQSYLQAEEENDEDLLLASEHRLQAELHSLPPEHPVRVSMETVYEGTGMLSLLTEPAGAEVLLHEYKLEGRRLQPSFLRSLGPTPITKLPLAMGSYLLEIRKEGFQTVHYPVRLLRQEHWDGVHPDGEPRTIWLPPEGTLGEDDCYVPKGWFWSGGDPLAPKSFPKQKLWLDSFVLRKFPVTNLEFIAFLDDLVRQGREEDALRCAPCERPGTLGEQGPMIYGRTPQGTFELRPDADGDWWYPDEPVTMIDWLSAAMYAEWMASQTGQPWRICTEWEWEKAARGVDARFFPWGNFFDHSWCCVAGSYPNEWLTAKVQEFPIDCSPYGVRGLAGNVREWCGEHYVPDDDSPPPEQPLVSAMPSPTLSAKSHIKVRGASWGFTNVGFCRAAARNYDVAGGRDGGLGFRLCRSLPESKSK